jgi:uncharacterized membrane protein
VTASTSGLKKITITQPLSILIFYLVSVVFTFHGYNKRIEVEAMALLGVPPGFFNLSNHAIIHTLVSPFRVEIKNSGTLNIRVPE